MGRLIDADDLKDFFFSETSGTKEVIHDLMTMMARERICGDMSVTGTRLQANMLQEHGQDLSW